MSSNYWPILLIIAGGVLYQVSQKMIAPGINAYLAIIVAYVIGILLCFCTAFIYPSQQPFLESAKKINWAVIGVGVGAAFIELGFLMAFRLGWKITLTSMLVNMLISLLILPIGILFFKEKISGWNILGITFYFAGLILLSRK